MEWLAFLANLGSLTFGEGMVDTWTLWSRHLVFEGLNLPNSLRLGDLLNGF